MGHHPLPSIVAIRMTWDNLLSGALGAGIIAIGQWIYHWWNRPSLSVSFQESKPGFIVFTSEVRSSPDAGSASCSANAIEAYKAMYVSIRIKNTGKRDAKNCRGFLVGIDVKNNGRWEPTDYCDSIPLAWSYRSDEDALHGIDIPHGVGQFLNIFSVRQPTVDSGFRPATVPNTLRYAARVRFKNPGEFRFRIQVAAADLPAQLFGLFLSWDGAWDDELWKQIRQKMRICECTDLT